MIWGPGAGEIRRAKQVWGYPENTAAQKGKQWTRYLGAQTGCYVSTSPDGEGSVSRSWRRQDAKSTCDLLEWAAAKSCAATQRAGFFSSVLGFRERPGKRRGLWAGGRGVVRDLLLERPSCAALRGFDDDAYGTVEG